jgi:hypothetical protein
VIPDFIYFVGVVCGLSLLLPITWIGALIIPIYLGRAAESIGEMWRGLQ